MAGCIPDLTAMLIIATHIAQARAHDLSAPNSLQGGTFDSCQRQRGHREQQTDQHSYLLHANISVLVHSNMQTHAQPLMQRQAPRQSVGSWARNTSLTAPRQLAPLRSLTHPQSQHCIHSRARRPVTVAAASHADDFGSRLRRGMASRCTWCRGMQPACTIAACSGCESCQQVQAGGRATRGFWQACSKAHRPHAESAGAGQKVDV
jgi:hypothetical protein